jgi:hypothetical protein
MAKNNDKEKNEPVKQFRAGSLGCSIWETQHEDKTYYSATVSRAFTRDDGKTWEYSTTFGRDELPAVARLLDMAFAWIITQGGAK